MGFSASSTYWMTIPAREFAIEQLTFPHEFYLQNTRKKINFFKKFARQRVSTPQRLRNVAGNGGKPTNKGQFEISLNF